MSISDSTVKGKFDELAGKAKQAVGDLTGNQSTANSGATQEVKGHGEQAWGSVKEAAHDSTGGTVARDSTYGSSSETAADNTAHDARSSVTSTAENVKDHIKNAVNDFKR